MCVCMFECVCMCVRACTCEMSVSTHGHFENEVIYVLLLIHTSKHL